jgi:hypothetical protein
MSRLGRAVEPRPPTMADAGPQLWRRRQMTKAELTTATPMKIQIMMPSFLPHEP